MAKNHKRILDSVHGYITIENNVFTDFIDTVYFQRLRRVEQTSTRSIFPCARHDRFTHSLGVYYIGKEIVKTLHEAPEASLYPSNKDKVFKSYELACLLHDIGHSPFSHTFEKYFDNKDHNLSDMLKQIIDNNDFETDSDTFFHVAAAHEKMSAYVSLKVFKDKIEDHGADTELVTRMIIGCKYQDSAKKSFENAMIDLIHGEIIDADGIDYVCRDSLTSGYSTANVDTERLISSIRLHKDDNNHWTVCYTPKALNEIEAVLAIKSYQSKNIINHHTVVLEQELLKKAMESAAKYHFSQVNQTNNEAKEYALEKLCNVNALLETVTLPKHNTPIIHLTDDDFVSLMKYVPDDRYVKQWLSRTYEYVPLWKSTATFFTLFPELVNYNYTSNCWLFSDQCKQFIATEMKLDPSSIFICSGTEKYRGANASKVNFLIEEDRASKIVPYKEIYPEDKNTFNPKTKPFSYIFVPKSLSKTERDSLITKLQNKVEQLFFN